MKESTAALPRSAAIWGAGILGRRCLEKLSEAGVDVPFFIDRNPPPDGLCRGVRVITSEQAVAGELNTVEAVFLAFTTKRDTPVQILADASYGGHVIDYVDGLPADEMIQTGNRFYPHLCLARDGGDADQKIIDALAHHLGTLSNVGFYGDTDVHDYLLRMAPALRAIFNVIAVDANQVSLLADADVIFLGSTRWRRLAGMRKDVARLDRDQSVIDLSILEKIAPSLIPAGALRPVVASVYPYLNPNLEIESDLDFLLLDCPPRFLALLPNGLGYVHNILDRAGVRFQTVDADLLFYHRFHGDRILDFAGDPPTQGNHRMSKDPWAVDVAEREWALPECTEYFRAEIEELKSKIIAARPRIVGFSLHGTNVPITLEIHEAIRKHLPETLVLVGGYSCLYKEVGIDMFPDYDYMLTGEVEPTMEPLLKALVAGERPKDLPGVLSKFDSPDRVWVPAPLAKDLDSLDFPRYQWANINSYRNFNGYQLTPIVLTRGCRWSLCTFCAERFRWRVRSFLNTVDEIEWLYNQGCRLFHFNDSDLSGDPERLAEVCDEVRRRGLDISMMGQLRIHKKHDRAYFDRLKAGGVGALRFGVDAWNNHTIRLQNKGYTIDMVERALTACADAGIQVTVNLIVGVPGETEEDVDESIGNLVRLRGPIRTVENINTLMLFRGSFYWENPEKYNIRFREDRETLYQTHSHSIPSHLWYSENPYIDQDVRKARLDRVMKALKAHDVDIGEYARCTTDMVMASA